MFLKNLKSVRPELTNPDQGRCAIIFAGGWILGSPDADQFNVAIMRKVGLSRSPHVNHGKISTALKHIASTQGDFYIDLREGHIVAAANTGRKWYFFDSNDYGLWEYDVADDFVASARTHLTGEGWTGGNGIWTCAVT